MTDPAPATPGSDRRRSWTLLVLTADRGRLLGLTVSRRVAGGLLAALVVVPATLTGVAGAWLALRVAGPDVTLVARIGEQREMIEGFSRRAGELRREIEGWRAVHARIWEALGPERPAREREPGVGGATAASLDRPAPASPADELDLLAEVVGEEGENLRALDRLVGRARRALAALPSRWPVRGGVNSEFGRRRSPWGRTEEFHGGIDIAAARGTLVRAPAAGTVAAAGRHGDYGLAVILDHGRDLRTVYAHLSKVSVRAGQRVDRGMELGRTGNTGRSSGPHLHYEIFVGGRPVNPRAYLWD